MLIIWKIKYKNIFGFLWGYSFPKPLEILFGIAPKSIQKNLEKSIDA